MTTIHESEVHEQKLPGRYLRWLISKDQGNAKHLSVCMIRVPQGKRVKPAHAHPNGEEAIYVIKGNGQVWIDEKLDDIREGSIVLFPQGSIHMLRNTGMEEMKVICFFAPPSDLSTYQFYDDIDFVEQVP